MDPLADYLSAAYPEPVTLLGQRLTHFSVGHVELMLRFRNAYLTETKPTLDDLTFGVFICCQSWREALNSLARGKLKEDLEAWGRKLGPFDFSEKSKAFGAYLTAGASKPEVIPPDDNGGDDPGVSYVQAVRLFLMGELGCSLDEAMNYPWGLARWDYDAWQALQGRGRLVSQEIAEFMEWSKAKNLDLAGGKN